MFDFVEDDIPSGTSVKLGCVSVESKFVGELVEKIVMSIWVVWGVITDLDTKYGKDSDVTDKNVVVFMNAVELTRSGSVSLVMLLTEEAIDSAKVDEVPGSVVDMVTCIIGSTCVFGFSVLCSN